MSVLSFPRIVLNGTTKWNPATQNNQIGFGYNKDPITVKLPDGVTYDTYDQWLIEMNSQGKTNGDWNVYGQFHCIFDATVANLVSAPGITSCDDALSGAQLKFAHGVPKLVDVNPYSPVTSQIFLKTIMLQGQDGTGFSGPAAARMTSRRPFFSRNLGGLNIAGGMGVVWQTCIAKGQITWTTKSPSPMLEALQAAMETDGVKGLMLRFTSYSTIYFKEVVNGGWLGQPAKVVYSQLAENYKAAAPVNPGNIASTFNPATSTLTGAIGLWEEGDLITVPSGRIMAAGAPPSSAAITLGSAEAKVNHDQGVVSLDLMNAIPEIDAKNTVANLGILDLTAQSGSTRSVIGSATYAEYNQEAYNRNGGILDVAVSDTSGLDAAMLSLSARDGTCTPLNELGLTAQVDMRSVYVDLGNSGQFDVLVSAGGRALPTGVRIMATVIPSEQGISNVNLTGTPESTGGCTYPVNSDGSAIVTFDATGEGNSLIVVQPFTGDAPGGVAIGGGGLPAPTTGYAAIRVMPTDDNIAAMEPTWDNVYEYVLRPFDLVYRGMSCGIFNLGSEDAIKANANAIVGLTDLNEFESPLYMPVTRDLSTGRRKLLWKFLGFDAPNPPSA